MPYDGREVYLHWANRDQYYIKTSEYLTNFTFNLANAPELKGLFEQEERKVHCRIVDAAEGEHGNNKTTDKTERYFLILKDAPVTVENGDLVIQFEYRSDAEKSGQSGKWQEKRIEEAEKVVLEALKSIADAKTFAAPLSTMIGQEKNRTLLRRYINQYTSRNTMDYFIHKDLGGFMRRELDFYIKNEIMRLDDIESADVPRVDFYLSKIKVLRKIAHHLIDFMAQLENFQKKLWLKKKFVVETNYCFTLDRVPEAFYSDISANDAQREEWVKLFAIDELESYEKPLPVAFLKDNPFLVLDTAFFDDALKAKLLAEIQNLDEKSDGLIIHSENFQALNSIKEKYLGSVDCVYIDPPYNTDASSIVYKNNYKDSSWISLMENRFSVAQKLMHESSVIAVAIDDIEFSKLRHLMEEKFGQENMLGVAVVRSNPSGRSTPNGFSEAHDYALFAGATRRASVGRMPRNDKQLSRYSESDEEGAYEWVNFRKHGGVEASRQARPKMFYPFYVDSNHIRIPEMS
ncbi:MAG: DNA methyltransferase, partial [Nitrososphaerales archaeon]